MFATVFLKSLRDQRRALLGWSIGIVLLVVLEAALWPSIRNIAGVEEFLANYPEAMRKLFKLEQFSTGAGFMNAELFSALLPILFLVFGIGRGARMIAGEEEAGTLESLLVTQVSPVRLILEKVAALVVSLLILGIVLFAAVAGFSLVFGLGIEVADAATASLAMVLLGAEFGCFALAIGAITGRRSVAIGLAAIAALAAYLLYVAGELVKSVKPWQPLSPFHQALSGGPLGAGLVPAYGWMALVAVVVTIVALPIFNRRDIATR
jgi:ABC-2 type transport system permease protein